MSRDVYRPAARGQEALQRGHGVKLRAEARTDGSTTQGCLKSQGPQNIQDPLSLIFIARFRNKTEKQQVPVNRHQIKTEFCHSGQ